jgi:VWFA-related protein
VYVLQDWTANPAQLIQSIRNLSSAGGTSVFDAIYKTCRDKFNVTDDRQKVVVLITDGEDTTSNATFEQTLAMAKLSNVVVYVVGLRPENSLNTRELQGRKVLTDLADLTGGRIFYPKDSREQLDRLFQALQAEMRNEYSVVYDVEGQPDNTFHKVRIEVQDKGLRVHAPTGYYFRKTLALP